MRKLKHSQENRRIAWRHRRTVAWLLEMRRHGPRYRDFLEKYRRWEKTPEYQQETAQLETVIRQVREEHEKGL